jgi:hypothetical protein
MRLRFAMAGSVLKRFRNSVGNPRVYAILDRYQTQLVIKNATELNEIWYALRSGTFRHENTRAARALAKRLRPHVKDDALLKRWPGPDGS